MTDEELLRYSRHVLLDEIGIEGQARIRATRVLVVGAGGLGSPVALYLGSAGIGRLTVVDHDVVDLTNLQRQVAHATDRIGQAKVHSLREAVHALNPDVEVVACHERADAAWLARHVPEADVVVDCTDRFAIRHAINAACVAARVPLVSGAAIGFDAQVSVYDTRREDAPCYACLFPPDATTEEARCATMGVFAPLVGIVGSLQAAEALKLAAATGTSLAGRLLMLDARTMTWSQLALRRTPGCPVCGSRPVAATTLE